MSEKENAPKPEVETTKGEEGRPAKGSESDPLESLKGQLDSEIAEKNALGFKVRNLEKELKELRKSQTNRERDAAEGSGDFAKYKTETQKVLDELTAERDSLSTRLKTQSIEREFHKLRSKFANDEAVADAWALLSDKLDLDGDKVVVKDSPHSLETFVSKFLEPRPHMAANPKKSGSGANGAGNSATGGDITVEQLNRMTSAEQRAAMQKDPALAKKVLEGFKPS